MRRVKVYQYRVKDPITGRRYLTRYKLSEEEAAERYSERERLDYTEETRIYYDEGDAPISSHQIVFGGPPKRLVSDNKA
jgi:hypothetical protein